MSSPSSVTVQSQSKNQNLIKRLCISFDLAQKRLAVCVVFEHRISKGGFPTYLSSLGKTPDNNAFIPTFKLYVAASHWLMVSLQLFVSLPGILIKMM